ncbi:hypothetical protein GOP47_0021277 [Adiantum capillus-veneris]|uniref:Uncharacterized protein n=1 Tax=Adiantum capillus-veneris TaxID=13818 RepID=A0A9D4UB15_ADICA|nr:hypothetical protein GOP47_0020918 [Adiantum capillus-veneris]KAI5064607.1 hypothetical protein GOP47_0021277 [Adiantum capillus-veneris]
MATACGSLISSCECEQVCSPSPREGLLNAAWERRRRGHFMRRSRSIEEKSSQASRPRCKHCMPRSISLASGLDASGLDPGHRRLAHMGSLTDDDFEELKGCIELGFAFDEESIPELAHILPALPACYALRLASPTHEASSDPTWDLLKPDDTSDNVKEQLRHWAQAVACNVRICYQEQY